MTVRCNVFNPDAGESARIGFRTAVAGRVTLTVFNSAGERILNLWDGPAGAGGHSLAWDGKNRSGQTVASNLYLVVLSTTSGNEVKKVIVLK